MTNFWFTFLHRELKMITFNFSAPNDSVVLKSETSKVNNFGENGQNHCTTTAIRTWSSAAAWFLFVWRGIEKNKKIRYYFGFTLWLDLKFQLSVCVLTILPLGCYLVLWYEVNKKIWDILLHFPIPACGGRKPTWRSRIRWLAKWRHMKTSYSKGGTDIQHGKV